MCLLIRPSTQIAFYRQQLVWQISALGIGLSVKYCVSGKWSSLLFAECKCVCCLKHFGLWQMSWKALLLWRHSLHKRLGFPSVQIAMISILDLRWCHCITSRNRELRTRPTFFYQSIYNLFLRRFSFNFIDSPCPPPSLAIHFISTHPACPCVSPPCPRTCRARRVCCRRGPPPPPSRGGTPGRLGRAGGSGDLERSTINLAIKTNQ